MAGRHWKTTGCPDPPEPDAVYVSCATRSGSASRAGVVPAPAARGIRWGETDHDTIVLTHGPRLGPELEPRQTNEGAAEPWPAKTRVVCSCGGGEGTDLGWWCGR